ncbi:MAG: hypothetical protein AAFR05_05650, partial [Bacteroidota bacterium]
MPLTEDKIKSAGLRFLKAHYKFRPRVGPTTSQLDLQGAGGIIADGQLQFVTEENQLFIATFEATSEYLYEEVKFRPELRVLFWDSLAAGFITAAATYAYGLIWDQFTIRQVGIGTTLSVLLAAGFVGFWIYRFTVRNWSRYRYIYAIEQFKRYHADEQWIAIADSIFPNSEDPYFDELRRQCVRNGVGLLLVERDESVQLLISPARREVFSNKRRLMRLVQQEYLRGRSWGRRLSDRGRNLLDQIFGRVRNNDSLQRFRRSFYKQMLLCSAALGLILTIFIRQLKDRPLAYVNERVYGPTLRQEVSEGPLETLDVLVDSAALIEEGRYQEPYLEVAQEPVPIREVDEVWIMRTVGEAIPAQTAAPGGEIIYDCERLRNFEGALFLVKYEQLTPLAAARKRVADLAERGLTANILWRACFEGGADDYLLYFDLFFPDREEAATELQRTKSLLQTMGLPIE